MTMLMETSALGHAAVVEVLLARGASANQREQATGFTPLMVASVHGHAPIVKKLLQAGARVGASTPRHGDTALILAERNGRAECADVIREHLAARRRHKARLGLVNPLAISPAPIASARESGVTQPPRVVRPYRVW